MTPSTPRLHAEATPIEGAYLVRQVIHADRRGSFRETFNATDFGAIGLHATFVQDNLAWSRRNVIRGLHYQWPSMQVKLIAVLVGRVRAVVLDVRRRSATFGTHAMFAMDADAPTALWIPPGCAFGYAVESAQACVHYKVSCGRVPDDERRVAWNDPALAISWGVAATEAIVSDADAAAPCWADAAIVE